jgi:hypothetical protein
VSPRLGKTYFNFFIIFIIGLKFKFISFSAEG